MSHPNSQRVSEDFAHNTKRTEAVLVSLFDDARQSGAAERLIDAMQYATMNGGKRIRANLVMTASRLVRVKNPPDERGALRVAAAIECLHAYSLIHDDLPAMDDAELRRGKPACHLAFDQATAILAGDALQSMAFEILASPKTHPDASIRAALTAGFARAIGPAGMAGGQMLDMEASSRQLNLAETRRMQMMKTGALIKISVVAGYQIGGEQTMLANFEACGEAMGKAFQIADDALDYSGETSVVGKPLGRDDTHGKATLIAHLGIDAARAEAKNLTIDAIDALKRIKPVNPDALDNMLAITSFIIDRAR